MVRALGFKMKVCFIYGRFEKPKGPYELAKLEMCNSAVVSLIINSLSKKINALLVHMNDAAQAWADLEIRYGGSNGLVIFIVQEVINRPKKGDMSVAACYNKMYSL